MLAGSDQQPARATNSPPDAIQDSQSDIQPIKLATIPESTPEAVGNEGNVVAVVDADTIDEEEFVQALWDELKCVGDLYHVDAVCT